MLSKTRSRPLASPRGGMLSRVALLAVACLVSLASNATAAKPPVGLGTADNFAVLGGAGGSVGVAAAAAARSQGAASSSQPPPSEPSLEELQDTARQVTGDFTPPTVRIGGKRRVRSPRVARLRIVARDNRRVAELEVFVDGKARHLTSKSGRKLVMRLRFRRGRHTIVAHAVDGATTSSRLARATIVVVR